MNASPAKVVPQAVPPPVEKIRRYQGLPMLEGHKRQRWFLKAGADDTQDDIRRPQYFGAKATHFSRHDIISILADDETFELELCVERVTQDAVFTSVRKVFSREGMGEGTTLLAPNFRTKRVGGQGWCVERINDGCLIITGHESEGAAKAQFFRQQPKQAA